MVGLHVYKANAAGSHMTVGVARHIRGWARWTRRGRDEAQQIYVMRLMWDGKVWVEERE